MKFKGVIYFSIISFLILVSQVSALTVNIPVPTNLSTINVNNSQYLQGLTPQQVANLFVELDPNYFSNPRNYLNLTTLPATNLSGYIPYIGATQDVDLGIYFMNWGNSDVTGRGTAWNGATTTGDLATAWNDGVAYGGGSTAWNGGQTYGLGSTAGGDNVICVGNFSICFGDSHVNNINYSFSVGFNNGIDMLITSGLANFTDTNIITTGNITGVLGTFTNINVLANINATNYTIGNTIIINSSSIKINASSTTALGIYNGTSGTVFIVDSKNNRVGINKVPTGTLDVTGLTMGAGVSGEVISLISGSGGSKSGGAFPIGGTGGNIVLTSGTGGNASGGTFSNQAGAGGSFTFTSGNGGNSTGAGGLGGAGGFYSFTSGNGGTGSLGGGIGGTFGFTSGNGGTGPNGQSGGAMTFTSGNGALGTTGINGSGGAMTFVSGSGAGTSGLNGNINFNPAGVNELSVRAGQVIVSRDNTKLLFGTGSDASIYYDGTNMIINPAEVGTGALKVLANLNVAGNLNTSTFNVGTPIFMNSSGIYLLTKKRITFGGSSYIQHDTVGGNEMTINNPSGDMNIWSGGNQILSLRSNSFIIYKNTSMPTSTRMFYGTSNDASVYYDGTNMIVNPKEAGTGNLKILGDINVTGIITTANATAYTNQVVCYLAGGTLGHCTSVVGITGACTCVAN